MLKLFSFATVWISAFHRCIPGHDPWALHLLIAVTHWLMESTWLKKTIESMDYTCLQRLCIRILQQLVVVRQVTGQVTGQQQPPAQPPAKQPTPFPTCTAGS